DRPHQAWARFVRARLDRRQPREALDHRVVGRLLGIGPLFAETADRDIDDLRRYGTNRLLAAPEPLGDAGTEVLDEDIRTGDQPHYGLQPGRSLQVEDDRA